jgi:predicted cupin superfamily sugar epimerase
MTDRPELAVALGLEPHPEGGWFAETFRAEEQVTVDRAGQQVARSAVTLINFFLPAGAASAWHLVASTEIWIWQGPGPITLQLGGTGDRPADRPETYRLGADPAAGERPQLIIDPYVWQRTVPAEQDALASCVVSPGFDFEDFRLEQ